MAQSSPKRRKLHHGSGQDIPTNGNAENGQTTSRTETFAGAKQTAGSASTRKKPAVNSGLYTADLLQLQIDELLKDLSKSRRNRLAAAESHLRKLKTAIEAIPDQPPMTPVDGERLLSTKHKVATPFPSFRPDKKAKYTVGYTKPARINVVGSFALDTAFVDKRSMPTVDMAITMPASLFQDKDYLDHRYFVKRAFYLANVAAGLVSQNDLGLSLEYEYQSGNQLQPTIVATPTDEKLRSQYRIRIIIAAAASFAENKTLPTKNCIRKDGQADSTEKRATPVYNGTLRSECNVEAYLKMLHSTKAVSEAFPRACALLSVWLRQRGLGSSLEKGGFGAFEAAVLMALLIHGGGPAGRPLLSSGYSHFQFFKAIIQLLASRDLVHDPLIIGKAQSLADIKDGQSPLVWDGDRASNLLYKMTAGSYASLQYWAQASLAAFDVPAADQLDALFLRRCDLPEQRFDDICELKTGPRTRPNGMAVEGVDESVTYAHEIFALLKEALGPRATLVESNVSDPISSWAIRQSQPPRRQRHIRVGLVLDSTHLHRAVDRGPSAEEKLQATQFREFWGEKAELRRFQDSSILESIVWDENGSVAIHRQAIDYICGHRLSQTPQYKALDIFARDISSQDHASQSLSIFNGLWRSYESLQDSVRNLEHLPLQVRNFVPTAYSMENTGASDQRTDVLEIGLQFEGTSRWPDDLVAIQRTKIAFLAKLQSLLQSSRDDFVYRLQQENALHPLTNCAFLEALDPDTGCLMRIRIFHEREISLLNDGLRKTSSPLERQACSDALFRYNKNFVRSPEHLQAIRRLSLQHPLLLPTVMLFRKWCSSHLLTPHLQPELQDLIVAHIFTSPTPFTAPNNASAGLTRVLHFLSKWSWRDEPLIVDLGDMTPQLRQESLTRFEAWRKIDPGLNRTVMFVASNLSVDGTTWSQHSPSKAVASRLTALATAAVARVTISDMEMSFQEIFSTGMGDYDFVIHLAPELLKSGELVPEKPIYKNLQPSGTHSALDGSNDSVPKMFVEEIEQLFSEALVLFHDFAERPIVAGVWKPRDARQWKATLDYSTLPQKSQEQEVTVAVNRDAILHEIARLGGSLVDDIEVRGVV